MKNEEAVRVMSTAVPRYEVLFTSVIFMNYRMAVATFEDYEQYLLRCVVNQTAERASQLLCFGVPIVVQVSECALNPRMRVATTPDASRRCVQLPVAD
jgi:hypothetical protein